MKKILLVFPLILMTFANAQDKKIADYLLKKEIVSECNDDFTSCQNLKLGLIFKFKNDDMKLIAILPEGNGAIAHKIGSACVELLAMKTNLKDTEFDRAQKQVKTAESPEYGQHGYYGDYSFIYGAKDNDKFGIWINCEIDKTTEYSK